MVKTGQTHTQSSNLPTFQAAPRLIAVQHHHAHIVSVMAEHGLQERVIGVALDGTGYGTDGTIWGGEFLLSDRADFTRVGHFKAYPLPGGDKAVEEPWRMALSVLTREGLIAGAPDDVASHKFQAVQRMVETGFHSPLTSSAGRLFDAVSSILGLCDVATYEAQAAIRLESVADSRQTGRYPFRVETTKSPWTLDFGPAIQAIVEDRCRGLTTPVIAAKFHNTVASAVARVCVELRAIHHLNIVALSGGVFQNALLLKRTLEALGSFDFRVVTNSIVPPNDGGLALGQAAVAVERMRRMEQTNGGANTSEESSADAGSGNGVKRVGYLDAAIASKDQ